MINYTKYYWQNDLVRLRAIQENDWEQHYNNSFDSEARRFLQLQIELPSTEYKEREFISKNMNFTSTNNGMIMFSIETIDGKLIGGIVLNSIDEKNGTFSIGMQIDRDHRGKGYGTAAMQILLGYAFNERRMNKFNGAVLAGNVASIKMMKKLGCIEEGVRKENIYTNGQYIDEILFGLTRKNFKNDQK
jgi:RimJ/RimL family protein N-acetyltransferase